MATAIVGAVEFHHLPRSPGSRAAVLARPGAAATGWAGMRACIRPERRRHGTAARTATTTGTDAAGAAAERGVEVGDAVAVGSAGGAARALLLPPMPPMPTVVAGACAGAFTAAGAGEERPWRRHRGRNCCRRR